MSTVFTIFGRIFRRIVLGGFFWEDFLGGFFERIFGRIAFGGILWEELFVLS